jgi:hypothetical protein
MVENQNNIGDDLRLTLDEFNSLFGLYQQQSEDILSETGLTLLSSTFVSIDMIRTVSLYPLFFRMNHQIMTMPVVLSMMSF